MKKIFEVSRDDDTSTYQVYVEAGVSVAEVMYGVGIMLRTFKDAEMGEISTMLLDINRYATDKQFDSLETEVKQEDAEDEDYGLD